MRLREVSTFLRQIDVYLDTIFWFSSGSKEQNAMSECYELYDDCLFFAFFVPVPCVLSIFKSRISTFISFTNFLTFSGTFSGVSSFSHGVFVIHRLVLQLYSLLHLTKWSRLLHFSWNATLLSQYVHVLLKQTDGRR